MADWQKGDLAMRVRPASPRCPSMKPGRVFEVEAVIPSVKWKQGHTDAALVLAGTKCRNPCGGFYHRNFIKITPGTKIEGVEVERRVPKRVKQDA